MQRRLHTRECGGESRELDHIFAAQWTNLAMDCTRGYDVKYCDEARFLNIDRISGSLILCGGSTNSAYGDPYSAAVGVFRYIEKGQVAKKDHLAHYTHVQTAPVEFIRGIWHPHTQDCFLTGSSDYAEVMLWDTNRFIPVTYFDLDDDDAVLGAAMSHAPGAVNGLVAVGTFHCKEVKLAAMNIGIAVHKMQLPVSGVAGINDINWSPVNPYMIACVDTEGAGFLFDTRMSGTSSCLLQFDESRRIPGFEDIKSGKMSTSRGVPQYKSIRRAHQIETSNLLGLGCAWDNRIYRCLDETDDFSEETMTLDGPKPPQMARIRFTPDGLTAVTVDVNGLIRTWDILTGRLVRTFYNAASFEGKFQGFHTPFEITPDGSHILCTPHKGDRRGSLLALDSEGHEISCAEAPAPSLEVTGMEDLKLHPIHEEAYCIPGDCDGNKITCWNPRINGQLEKIVSD